MSTKTCNISETVQDRTKVDGLIGRLAFNIIGTKINDFV